MTEVQEAVLRDLAKYGPTGGTAPEIARGLNAAKRTCWSWQGVSRVCGQLERAGLISVRRLPRMTVYEITKAGQDALAERKA